LIPLQFFVFNPASPLEQLESVRASRCRSEVGGGLVPYGEFVDGEARCRVAQLVRRKAGETDPAGRLVEATAAEFVIGGTPRTER
jgi:hypothetical protein